MVCLRLLLLAAAVLVAACGRDGARAAALHLRGRLVPFVEHPPATLASCDSVGREYSRPFWRAPYRACGSDREGARERLEIDADSVVTEVYSMWEVPHDQRDRRFAQIVKTTSKVLGAGRRCSARKVEWLQGDTLHAILQVTPMGDIGPLEDAPTWQITRLTRLGPLDATTWACGSVASAI